MALWRPWRAICERPASGPVRARAASPIWRSTIWTGGTGSTSTTTTIATRPPAPDWKCTWAATTASLQPTSRGVRGPCGTSMANLFPLRLRATAPRIATTIPATSNGLSMTGRGPAGMRSNRRSWSKARLAPACITAAVSLRAARIISRPLTRTRRTTRSPSSAGETRKRPSVRRMAPGFARTAGAAPGTATGTSGSPTMTNTPARSRRWAPCRSGMSYVSRI